MPSNLLIEALGVTVAIDLSGLDPHVCDAVRAAWADTAAAPAADAPAAVIEAASVVDDPAGSLTYLLEVLSQRVTVAAIDARRGELWMLHAAGLALDDGRVVVLIGPSGRGKTTASRTLGQTLGYVSDETVAIAPDGRILPYRKPLSIIEDPSAPKVQRPATDVGLRPLPDAPLRLAALVLLDRSPDAGDEPVVSEVDLGDALGELVAQSSYLPSMAAPLRTIAALAASVGGVQRVRYREATTLLPTILALAEPAPHPPLVEPAPDPPLVEPAPDPPLVEPAPDPPLVEPAPHPPLVERAPHPPLVERAPHPPLDERAQRVETRDAGSGSAGMPSGSASRDGLRPSPASPEPAPPTGIPAQPPAIGSSPSPAPLAETALHPPLAPRAQRVETIPTFTRTPVLDHLDLVDPDRLALLSVDDAGDGTVRVLAGIAPALWRAADAASMSRLVDAVVTAHGTPEGRNPEPLVAAALAELVAAGLVARDDEDGAHWRIRDDVAWTDTDRVVALDLSDPAAPPHALEGSATTIWRAVAVGAPDTAGIVQRVADAVGASAAEVATDVEAFLAELAALRLIGR